jgi:hypothetical protein
MTLTWDARAIAQAYILDGEVRHIDAEGSLKLEKIYAWVNALEARIVVRIKDKFYVLGPAKDRLDINYLIFDDLDAAITAAILESRRKV